MKKFGERNGQCKMNYKSKSKSQIKDEAFEILQELAMKDIYCTYNIMYIEKSAFKPQVKIRVSSGCFKKFLDMLIDNGITFLCYEKLNETEMTISIPEFDIYKISNEKIKRLHDCIEDL